MSHPLRVLILPLPFASSVQRHLSNRERKEAAKAARKERRQKERTKKGEGEGLGEHHLIGAMAI